MSEQHHQSTQCETLHPDCIVRLANIEAKLDSIIQAKQDDKEKSKDVETRLRLIERRDAAVVGICALLVIFVPIIVKKFGF